MYHQALHPSVFILDFEGASYLPLALDGVLPAAAAAVLLAPAALAGARSVSVSAGAGGCADAAASSFRQTPLSLPTTFQQYFLTTRVRVPLDSLVD